MQDTIWKPILFTFTYLLPQIQFQLLWNLKPWPKPTFLKRSKFKETWCIRHGKEAEVHVLPQADKLKPSTCNFSEIALHIGGFPCECCEYFQNSILQNTSGWLLLNFSELEYTWISIFYVFIVKCVFLSRTGWEEN